MTLARGRVIKADGLAADRTEPLVPRAKPGILARGDGGAARVAAGRVVPAARVRAAADAAALVRDAERRAAAVLDAAQREATEVRREAETAGRAAGAAQVAAMAIALNEREARADAAALDRTVELAQLLAERLLARALELSPELVAGLAQQALREARGARAVAIVAHPDDVAELRGHVAALGGVAVTLREAPDRPRGSLRLETDVGVLDGDIAPQLERLGTALRAALKEDGNG